MSSNFQNRLYEMEVTPPQQVWDNLAAALNEINADNKIAGMLEQSAINPPVSLWNEIKKSAFENQQPEVQKNSRLVFLKRIAAAAVVIGLVASAWFIYSANSNTGKQIVSAETKKPTEKLNKPETSKTLAVTANADNKNKLPVPDKVFNKKDLTTISPDKISPPLYKTKKDSQFLFAANKNTNHFYNEKPLPKIFDQPIDDLSMVATGDKYLTMVNANGRMVKIPAHLAHLAPHLQNKPVIEDYYEFLFREGIYWKEQLNTWRQQLATAPVSSGDIFSTMMDLLKSVQDN